MTKITGKAPYSLVETANILCNKQGVKYDIIAIVSPKFGEKYKAKIVAIDNGIVHLQPEYSKFPNRVHLSEVSKIAFEIIIESHDADGREIHEG